MVLLGLVEKLGGDVVRPKGTPELWQFQSGGCVAVEYSMKLELPKPSKI